MLTYADERQELDQYGETRESREQAAADPVVARWTESLSVPLSTGSADAQVLLAYADVC